MKFYNRKEEISILQDNENLAEKNAMFTVLSGRRRIGKTSLVTKAFEGKPFAYLFVSKDSEAIFETVSTSTLKEFTQQPRP